MSQTHRGDIGLRVQFEERQDLTALALSSTIYDFNLLYDWAVLVSVPEYEGYRFSQFFWFRNGRPVRNAHALHVHWIRHESPLGVELIIPLAAAAASVPWVLLQSIQKIQNWRLDRRKLQAEVRDLESRDDQRRAELQKVEAERDAAQYQREIARLELEDRKDEIARRATEIPSAEIERRLVQRIEQADLTAVDADFIELDLDDDPSR
jgi:hypothetical protein